MKRNIIATLLAGLFLVAIYSFTLIKPGTKKAAVKTKAKQEYSCGTVVQSIVSKTYNYGANTVTIVFSITGGAAHHYTCGGNWFCDTGSSFFTTTSTTSVTIPLGPGGCGGNSRIIPICTDGTEGASLLFSF